MDKYIKEIERNLLEKNKNQDNQIEDLKNKSLNCEMINVQDLKDMKENLLALYPSVGENLDYINSNNLK